MAEKADQKQGPKRQRLSQDQVPSVSLNEAMRVPKTLADSYGKDDSTPLQVAKALEMTPSSGPFRTLAGAAKAYGLTTGGANAESIGLTDLGRRAVAPLADDEDLAALKTAALTPSVQRAFLEKYDQSPLPKPQIARNVLEELGIPGTATERAHSTILQNARDLGFVEDLKGTDYLDLGSVTIPSGANGEDDTSDEVADEEETGSQGGTGESPPTKVPEPSRRVFVSHGSNKRIVEQLKALLTFGEFEPVVSTEKETVSKPVSEKVFGDMRSCGAGIIHVSPEDRLMDKDGNERPVLNENVLIEIGAAMALYPKRFILLVEDGTNLPSNLSGLYAVRYVGSELDYDATMKVLNALNEFKSTN